MHALLLAVLPLFMAGRFEVVKRLGSFDQFLDRSALRELHIHREHMDIANAIVNHEAEAAERAMKRHLDRAIAAYGNLAPVASAETSA